MVIEEFGAKVRDERKKMGLSQEKFALKIQLDRTYLASVEKGRRNISLKNLIKISEGLDMSLSELFEGIGVKESGKRS